MELLKQATIVMLLGMSLVFVFLALVILCVQAVARQVRRYEERHRSEDAGHGKTDADNAVIAAIALAVERAEVRGQESGVGGQKPR
jgi:sodium pump decarboxylase gamma subunit